VCKLKELAEGNNEENEGCIQRVKILMTISVVNYLIVTRVDNVSSRHKGERALKHNFCSRPVSLTSSDIRQEIRRLRLSSPSLSSSVCMLPSIYE